MEFELQSGFNYSGTYYKMTPKGKELLNKSNMNVLPIRYTPDFIGKENNWIIETKGFSPSQHTFPMRWKLFLKHLVDSGKPLPALFMPKNKMQVDECVEIIKNLIKNGHKMLKLVEIQRKNSLNELVKKIVVFKNRSKTWGSL
jgi:hypothetical protein